MTPWSKSGLIAVNCIFLVLCSAFVTLRLYARKKQRLPYKLDDVFAVAALVFFYATSACLFASIYYKFNGYAFKDLTPTEIAAHAEPKSLTAIIWNIFLAFAGACIKLSILFYYRRIFHIPGIPQTIDYLTLGTAVICVLYALTFAIFPWFQCGPDPRVLWSPSDTAPECKQEHSYYQSVVISNFILDLWIMILPIPNILRLKVSTSERLSVLGVFCLAFLGLIASVARVVIYLQITLTGTSYFTTHDYGIATSKVSYFTMIELGICLVAVNLPTLWVLFKRMLPARSSHDAAELDFKCGDLPVVQVLPIPRSSSPIDRTEHRNKRSHNIFGAMSGFDIAPVNVARLGHPLPWALS